MENIILEKKEFRKKIKSHLSQLEEKFFLQKSEEICKNILSWEIYQKAKTILFYIENPEKAEEMGREGREKLKSATLDKVYVQWKNYMKQVAENTCK